MFTENLAVATQPRRNIKKGGENMTMKKFTLEELKAVASYLNAFFFPLWLLFYNSEEEASAEKEALDRIIFQLELFFEGREFMFSASDVYIAYEYICTGLKGLFHAGPTSVKDEKDYEMLSRAAEFLKCLYKTMS